MAALFTLAEVTAILCVTFIVAFLFRRVYMRKSNIPLSKSFLYHTILGAIYICGGLNALAAIPQLNNFASTLLAGSGIAALGLSLSAQESLSNVVSGLFITIFKPFEVGDRITLVGANITGYIESISLRHTVIKTLTNTRVIVPNSTMNKEIVENAEIVDKTASYFLDVDVSYESDIELAKSILAETIFEHPLYLQENPAVVQVRAFEASGVSLRCRVWTKTVDDNFTACSDIRSTLLQRFKENGIEIPYQKIVVHTVPFSTSNPL